MAEAELGLPSEALGTRVYSAFNGHSPIQVEDSVSNLVDLFIIQKLLALVIIPQPSLIPDLAISIYSIRTSLGLLE